MFERFTDRARRVVVLAQEEARMLNHSYIGTEHILLGLIREGEGVAAQVLQKLGADLNRVRQQVIQLLSGYQGKEPAAAGGPAEGAPVDAHSLAYRVDDVEHVAAVLRERGLRLLYDAPKRGTSDSRVNFIHPKDAGGILVELVEPSADAAH